MIRQYGESGEKVLRRKKKRRAPNSQDLQKGIQSRRRTAQGNNKEEKLFRKIKEKSRARTEKKKEEKSEGQICLSAIDVSGHAHFFGRSLRLHQPNKSSLSVSFDTLAGATLLGVLMIQSSANW